MFRECPNVFLFVASFHPRAKQLYLRLGYQEVGILKDYLSEGLDEILLRKTIGPLNTSGTV